MKKASAKATDGDIRPEYDLAAMGPAVRGKYSVGQTTKRPVTVKGSDGESTHFITVDLDVFSRWKLTPLAAGMGDVVVLYEGRYGHRYSAHFSGPSFIRRRGREARMTVDQEIMALVRIVKRLSGKAKRQWAAAESRIFNVGLQAGLHPHSHEVTIAARTMRAVVDVGASLAFTTYAPAARPSEPPLLSQPRRRSTTA